MISRRITETLSLMTIMRQITFLLAAVMLVLSTASVSGAPWGKQYFPNVPLTTQSGDTVRFFDDLIEGKIVVLNFIYTTCPDTCPLETVSAAVDSGMFSGG